MTQRQDKLSRWRLKNMQFLLYPFHWPSQSARESVCDSQETASRALVARLAKGNVLLQAGRYQTEEQLTARAAHMSAHRFIDHADD